MSFQPPIIWSPMLPRSSRRHTCIVFWVLTWQCHNEGGGVQLQPEIFRNIFPSCKMSVARGGSSYLPNPPSPLQIYWHHYDTVTWHTAKAPLAWVHTSNIQLKVYYVSPKLDQNQPYLFKLRTDFWYNLTWTNIDWNITFSSCNIMTKFFLTGVVDI